MSCLGSTVIRQMIDSGMVNGGNHDLISPASLDFRLSKFLYMLPAGLTIDTKNVSNIPWEQINIPEDGYIMLPNTLYLGSTIESLNLSKTIVAMAEGKSTIGRCGLTVHVTAGWIDPGFVGTVTLEMVATNPIRIYEGLKIGQFTFFDVIGNAILYDGRYQSRQFGMPVCPRDGGLFVSLKK